MMPRVLLLATTHFDVDAFCSFVREAVARETHAPSSIDEGWNRSPGATEAEELVEAAGRVCYMSFASRQSPKSNTEYIHHLIQSGHESVLEHVNWTFLLDGVSRAFTHQLVRHRVGFAFSQLSQQYHDEAEAEFVEPLQLEQFPESRAAWLRCVEAARTLYSQIRDEVAEKEAELGLEGREATRAIRSIARSVLPNATATKIVVTANARAVRHFLRVRGSIPGDTEMRLVAAELLKILTADAPALFFDFHIEKLSDGSPIVIHTAPKDST